ncbi:MAG: 1,4-dihydroxy-2-naphthoate octaprenyltransferase [Bacteroidia bacterium]|nr:1,4-dihydroxy-2-naphthoate octaprenyltransferase [Bacteroidia bacterium]
MMRWKIWIQAFRPKTLPLALSCTVTGTFLALSYGHFRWPVFLLTLFTTLSLQILSNLANDYGDAKSGADNLSRVGPQRVTATGRISPHAIKRMILFFAFLSLFFGVTLIIFSLRSAPVFVLLLFLVLGLAALSAAIRYTVGSRPYGYRGWGDLYVFLFFGMLGVVGTFVMQTQTFSPVILLPAAAIGLFSTAVLNLNNLRDEANDRVSGKRTLVVIKGQAFGKRYHTALLLTGLLMALAYTFLQHPSPQNFLWMIVIPLFYLSIFKVNKALEPTALIRELQQLALSAFLFSLLFGISLNL